MVLFRYLFFFFPSFLVSICKWLIFVEFLGAEALASLLVTYSS